MPVKLKKTNFTFTVCCVPAVCVCVCAELHTFQFNIAFVIC